MSEAYEIGVTLALSDGVSEGIERARRDMAQFEKALASGGVTVQQLRRAAVGAVAPQPLVQPAPKAESRLVERGDDVPKADAGPGVRIAEVAFATPRVIGGTADRLGVAPVKPAAAPVATMAQADSAAGGRAIAVSGLAEGAPRLAALGEAVKVIAAAPPPQPPAEGGVDRFAASARPGGAGLLGAAPTMPQPGLVQVPATAPMSRLKLDEAPAWSVAPVVQPAPSLGGLSDRGSAPVQPSGPVLRVAANGVSVAPTVRVVVPGDGGAAPRPPVRLAPPERHDDGAGDRMAGFPFGTAAQAPGGTPGVAGGAPVAGEAGGNRAPAAPPAVGQAQGPTEGDVFLDGMLVGRWIARFLADEVGRAPAGPTGFDGRRGRVLPGPTVGG